MRSDRAQPRRDAAPGKLRRLWRGFSRWRKKYWLTRLLVLLIIFSPALYEVLTGTRPIIVRLISIACDAIFLSGEPTVGHHLARYYRAGEKDRLRMALTRDLDADENGTLSATEAEKVRAIGLDPAQLARPIHRADLEELGRAAKRLGLVPDSYSTRAVRLRALHAARAETERLFRPHHRADSSPVS
jgi:hypothetical protein